MSRVSSEVEHEFQKDLIESETLVIFVLISQNLGDPDSNISCHYIESRKNKSINLKNVVRDVRPTFWEGSLQQTTFANPQSQHLRKKKGKHENTTVGKTHIKS